MKTHTLRHLIPVLFPLPLLAGVLHAAETPLPVGSTTVNLPFAVRSGSQFENKSFDDYPNCILVVMMQTPWCPTCQSVGIAVGNGILDHFNNPGRGALTGKNKHGIEINSVMLSVEPGAEWDDTNSSFAAANGYEQWGLDADASRLNPRILLGHFRGGFPNGVNSSNLYDWGNDRRRVVVLNMVDGSPTHMFRQILINQNSFASSNYAAAQAAIDSVQQAPPTPTYATWSAGFSFTSGESDPADDPDLDGIPNGIEAFMGTHPLQNGSRSLPTAAPNFTGGTHLEYSFQRAQSVPGDLIIDVQVTNSLASGSWTTIKQMTNGAWSGTAMLTEGTPNGSLVPVTVLTDPGGPRQFVRLKVRKS